VVTIRHGDGFVSFDLNEAEVGRMDLRLKGDLFPALSLEAGESVAVRLDTVDQSAAAAATSGPLKTTPAVADEPKAVIDAKSLEALGADALKNELKSLGLKFGGTVQERAKRLFIAQTVPREDW